MATKKKSKAHVLAPGVLLNSFSYYFNSGSRAFVDIGGHTIELNLGDEVIDPVGAVELALEKIAEALKPYREES